MKDRYRYLTPLGVGVLAAALLAGVYIAIVSLAESPKHALDQFLKDRWLVVPILVGFGVQASLYSILKLRLYLPAPMETDRYSIAPGASMGAGGTASTIAMVACCAHHVTDVLPVLGLTAAATFLAEYQTTFLVAGLSTNLIGIAVILLVLLRARQNAISHFTDMTMVTEEV